MPWPPSCGAANTPVSKAPRIPPTPCTPNTSSESSTPSRRFKPFTPHRQTTPAIKPITRPPIGPTKPAAGVMPTRPATAPDAPPSMEGLPLVIHSPNTHDKVAAAVASKVLTKAKAATSPASSEEPALKPNQPTHSREAPIMVIVSECGAIDSRPRPTRLPIMTAPTKPAIAALICTTVPPAKSSAPFWNNQPEAAVSLSEEAASMKPSGPGQNQTMWAIGRYEKVNQITENATTAENFTRSAKEPMISATVIAANAPWKATNDSSGITTPLLKVAVLESPVRPCRNR